MCLSDLSDRITQIRMPHQDTSSSYCDTHSLQATPPLPTTFSIQDTEMQSVAVDGGMDACKELEEGGTVRAAAEAYTKEWSKESKECKEHLRESLDFPHSPECATATLAGELAEPEEHWQTSEQEASQELATWRKLAGGAFAQLLVGEAGGSVGERESVWADANQTPLGKENEEEDECLLRARRLLAYLKGSL